MKEFYTAKAHSKPKKLPLYLPDGSPTDEYLMILGAESKPVRDAKARMYREKLQNDISLEDAKNLIISAMIESWSFDKECTEDNKINFLKEAPQIADKVDIFSANHANFTKK